MADDTKQGAVGDAARSNTMETDVNGARTAVGVPHPENRLTGQSLPAVDLPSVELDDYDDDKQQEPAIADVPPDQDAGESFREIVDVGETPEEHQARAGQLDQSTPGARLRPLVDNQTNQPHRFYNREAT